MIQGIGIDIVKNKRIQNVLTKSYNYRFLNKMLHSNQLATFQTFLSNSVKIQFVASRWAVKQAAVKALGKRNLIFNEMRVYKNQQGKSFLEICSEKNLQILRDLNVQTIHISFSHQDDYTIGHAVSILNQ